MQKVVLRVPGSCGELLQGRIEGQNFLVSCPINLYTKVSAVYDSAATGVIINQKASKTEKALTMLLEHYNCEQNSIKINIQSQLKAGIGMASSTADISAATAALMLLLNNKIDFPLLKKICLKIEPSDSVFLEGIRFFDHLQGKKDYLLGPVPELDILMFKETGLVDSLIFNRSKKLLFLNKAKEKEIKNSYKLLKKGLQNNDYQLIGRAATTSSLAHQKILYKRNLASIVKIIKAKKGVYGVNIAHSGTIIGILIDKNFEEKKLLAKIKENTTELEYLKRVKMISGGIERRLNYGASAWRKLNSDC